QPFRTGVCPMTRLAWSPGLAYTLHGRTVSRGFPAARAAGKLVPTARCSPGDRPWRDTHIWTLCRDSLCADDARAAGRLPLADRDARSVARPTQDLCAQPQ